MQAHGNEIGVREDGIFVRFDDEKEPPCRGRIAKSQASRVAG